jgi:hypothetical protein
MKSILEVAAKVIVILIAIYFVADMFKRPEPIPEVVTTIKYEPGRPDTVTVRDTVYISATVPVTEEEDGRLSIDTLIVHDEYTSVHIWSRDIVVEGLRVDVQTIVRQVHIHTVDTLKIIETRTFEKKIPWYRSQTFGIVIGATGTVAVLWATRRLE